jgi:hypothetical protein
MMYAWRHRDQIRVWARSIPILMKSPKERKRGVAEFRLLAHQARSIDLQRNTAHLAKANLKESVDRVEESLSQPISVPNAEPVMDSILMVDSKQLL